MSPVFAVSAACLLFPLFLPAAFAKKYVFVGGGRDWHGARVFCRENYIDLAPVNSEHDLGLLREVASRNYFWIGLIRSTADPSKWLWSGGGEVSPFFWEEGQPQNYSGEDYGLVTNFKLHDAKSHFLMPFMCFRATVVMEKKTWLEAVEYCREHDGDLASVASGTEATLLRRELAKRKTTGPVWIGLHFFPGSWLWTDGQPAAGYDGWGREGPPACPHVQMRCGTIRATEWDFYLEDGLAGNDWAGGEPVWETHDCEDRLDFICY